MPNSQSPTKGYSYRFNLGTPKSAVDIMFDVHVPGRRSKRKAVEVAKGVIEDTFVEDGEDFGDLKFGRIYFHPSNIKASMIVDIDEIEIP